MSADAPALDRGLAILELVEGQADPLAFGVIVERLGLPTASATRLLKVLCRRGYLVREAAGGSYRGGPRLAAWGQAPPLHERLRIAAEPVLQALALRTRHTAICLSWNGCFTRCVAKQLHERGLGMQRVGDIHHDLAHFPWHPWLLVDRWRHDPEAAASWPPAERERCQALAAERVLPGRGGDLHRPCGAVRHRDRVVGVLVLGAPAAGLAPQDEADCHAALHDHLSVVEHDLDGATP